MSAIRITTFVSLRCSIVCAKGSHFLRAYTERQAWNVWGKKCINALHCFFQILLLNVTDRLAPWISYSLWLAHAQRQSPKQTLPCQYKRNLFLWGQYWQEIDLRANGTNKPQSRFWNIEYAFELLLRLDFVLQVENCFDKKVIKHRAFHGWQWTLHKMHSNSIL